MLVGQDSGGRSDEFNDSFFNLFIYFKFTSLANRGFSEFNTILLCYKYSFKLLINFSVKRNFIKAFVIKISIIMSE